MTGGDRVGVIPRARRRQTSVDNRRTRRVTVGNHESGGDVGAVNACLVVWHRDLDSTVGLVSSVVYDPESDCVDAIYLLSPIALRPEAGRGLPEHDIGRSVS